MKHLKRLELQIPIVFLIVGSLWIVFTDKLFLTIKSNPTAFRVTELQTLKGSFFVFLVAVLIHFMMKRWNNRLRKSEEQYKQLFYTTPSPMLILDVETNRFCYVNEAALETYGYSAEELSLISINEIRHKEIEDKVLFNGEWCTSYEHKKKNNESLICIELTRDITYNNTPSKLLCIQDITILQKAKSKLEQRESLLNQILATITDGFFFLTPDMVIEKANDLFKRMVEVQTTTIEGKRLSELFPGIEERTSFQMYREAMLNRNAVHFETKHEKLGTWLHVSAYPFDSGLSVFFRDITKEKEEQLQRLQHQQNVLSLINNIDDLMWSVDCNFNYFIFNEPYRKNYQRVFGEDLYVGKHALNNQQGAGHIQKWKSLYERALNGERFTIDMDFVLDDECRFTTIHFNPIYDTSSNIIGAGCFMQDITERKLQLRKIEEQNEKLKQIAFITSHKVRVPLANLLGLTEILNHDDPLSSENAKIIEHIKTSAKELDRSIINMVQQTVHVND